MNNTETNPNDYESAINSIAKLWTELKQLMDQVDPRDRGIVTCLLSGRPITHAQYAAFETRARDLGYDLSSLVRAPKSTQPQPSPIEPVAESVKRRGSFQCSIDDLLREIVSDRQLNPAVLTDTEVVRVTLTYDETEVCWRSDSRDCELPKALVDAFEQNGLNVGDLMDAVVERINEHGSYEYFDNPECHDSEVQKSDITYEVHD